MHRLPALTRPPLRPSPRLPRRRVELLALVPAGLVVFGALATLWPPRSGAAALALVVEQQLFLAAAVLLGPVALLRRARLLALALVAALAFGGLRFGPEWVSAPPAGPAELTVMSWNLEAGSRPPAETVAALRKSTADVVAVQELEDTVARAVEADAALADRFPYRLAVPGGVLGLGLLSRYPLRAVASTLDPPLLEAIVESPRGPVRVLDAHPLPPWPIRLSPLALTYDTTFRDSRIERIRARVDEALSRGERLLLVGDFNTTPTEAAYGRLAAGLRDAHVEAGQGPGWTWRPPRLEFLGVGLLRIDLQLAGGALLPVSTAIDCPATGDHCRLLGGYRFG